MLGDPGPLQRVIALGIETFDCGDLFARGLRYRGLAGAHRFTVEVDKTGVLHQLAPQPNFVPVICKVFARDDDPQQGRVIRYIDRMVMPIDVQGDHASSTSSGFLFATDRRCGLP